MRVIYLSIFLVVLGSCSQYQKVLKKGTPAEKYEAAKKYYNKKDFVRAQPLFEELMGLYFGKPEREDIFFFYAYTHYGLSEYLLAGYYFNSFVQTYPLSKNREEAAYMAAVCEYHKSLPYELDQSYTKVAINNLQTFINQYPNSEYVSDCNQRMDNLRSRLLKKVYESAKLWYKVGDYKAAVVSCTNALNDYPDMIHRDELLFLVADASYIYAKNSIEKHREERFKAALLATDNFLNEYGADNAYHKETTKLKGLIEVELQQ